MVPARAAARSFSLPRLLALWSLLIAAFTWTLSLLPAGRGAWPDVAASVVQAQAYDPQPVLVIPELPVPGNAHPYPEALALAAPRSSMLADWTDLWSGRAEPGGPISSSGAPAGLLMPGAVVSGLMLSAEQLQISRFIADKYRLPVDEIAEVVTNAYFTARELRLDPLLVLAVISIESAFNRRARSDKGAEGLMQIRTEVHSEKFEPFGGRESAFDPVVNIQVGATMLRDHLLREGSVEAALKSYVGAARRRTDGGYALKVMRERDAHQEALAHQVQARLTELRP